MMDSQVYWSWQDIVTAYGSNLGWISELLTALNWILWVALVLVGACGAVYAIYIGVKMARADSSEQREEAKKRLINVIVALVVTIALILFFNLIMPAILSSMGVFDSFEGLDKESVIQTARTLIRK